MEQLRTAIQKLAKQDVFESILGHVVSVDTDAKTCVIQPLDDQPEILDVRLNAVESPSVGFILIPKVDSFVIAGQTANNQPHVLMYSECVLMTVSIEDALLQVNADGLKLSVGSNDLKEGLEELKSAIGQLKVMTSQGQSSIPINITAINSAFDKMLATLQ